MTKYEPEIMQILSRAAVPKCNSNATQQHSTKIELQNPEIQLNIVKISKHYTLTRPYYDEVVDADESDLVKLQEIHNCLHNPKDGATSGQIHSDSSLNLSLHIMSDYDTYSVGG